MSGIVFVREQGREEAEDVFCGNSNVLVAAAA